MFTICMFVYTVQKENWEGLWQYLNDEMAIIVKVNLLFILTFNLLQPSNHVVAYTHNNCLLYLCDLQLYYDLDNISHNDT